MQFGTLVLSKEYSFRTDYIKSGSYSYMDTMLLKVGKLIFQRPDNHSIIIEIEGSLLQDKPENVYFYNEQNQAYFKELMRLKFVERIERINQGIQKEREQIADCQAQVDTIQATINLLEEKNKLEFSNNRAKEIQGISKNQRKHQRKIDAVHQRIKDELTRIDRIQLEMDYSLKNFDKQIVLPK